MSEPLRQFLVGGYCEGTGDNLDMISTASSAAEAIELWHLYWPGQTVDRVHELPPVGSAPGVHEWMQNQLDPNY